MTQPQGMIIDDDIYDCFFCDLNYDTMDYLILHILDKHYERIPSRFKMHPAVARSWIIQEQLQYKKEHENEN